VKRFAILVLLICAVIGTWVITGGRQFSSKSGLKDSLTDRSSERYVQPKSNQETERADNLDVKSGFEPVGSLMPQQITPIPTESEADTEMTLEKCIEALRTGAAHALGNDNAGRNEFERVRKRLIEIGDEAVAALLELYESPSSTFMARTGVAYILAEIGDERCIDPFVASLHDRGHIGLEDLMLPLVKLAPKSVPILLDHFIDAVRHGDSWTQSTFMAALGQIPDFQDVEGLESRVVPLFDIFDMFEDPAAYSHEEKIYRCVRESLSKIGVPAVPYFAERLYAESAKIRTVSAICLGEIGDTSCFNELLDAAKYDEHSSVRIFALQALRKIEDERALPCFRQVLNDPTAGLERKEAALGLVAIVGRDAARDLMEAFRYEDMTYVKCALVRCLVEIGHKDAVNLIQERLMSESLDRASYDARCAMVRALGSLGDERVTDSLILVLNDPHGQVRREALKALSQIGSSQAVPAMLELANDDDKNVAECAINSVVEMTGSSSSLRVRIANTTFRQDVEQVANQLMEWYRDGKLSVRDRTP